MDRSIQSIFIEARRLSAPERDRYLHATCRDDAELRTKVESLLAADAEAGSFLQEPSDTALESHASDAIQSKTHSLAAGSRGESASTMIGPYKLLQQIGEGGMGTVWMAEQATPVQRRVAVKVIKAGMDSRQVIARFEAERQALAVMDHPNIAKVFDAGETAPTEGGYPGRPYFVMELVKGVPITTFCDAERLTVRERLALFLPVCHAVQHAHQKGIIHRDLKPTNILVTLFDGKPIPKVIDFGLAKATDHRLTDKTMFTEFGQIVGTLEYMSPEQARMDHLDIDTRSDIYSLGVVLYELLVGETPFDRQRLRSAAFDELLRIIREEEPPSLGMKLSGSGLLPAIAASRRLESKRLSALVKGELDWIVMKALDKDRARRYASANNVARNVERYLADETVEACPPSARYRLLKFLRRNKGAVLASAAVLTVLILGIIGTTIGLIGQARERAVAEQQRSVAQEQAQEAKRQAAVAEAVSRFQSDMLGSADPDNLLGDKVTVLQAVTAAIKELDGGKLKDQPLVEASLRQMIGSTLHGLGRLDAAESNLRKALELRRKALPAGDPLVAYSAYSFAVLLADKGRFTEAEPLYREAVDD